MTSNNYPVWGESSSAIAPQIYNWAQQSYAQQNANIGRQTDVDRQAIANANNYYQFARANEVEDARRQQEAASQTYNRQLAFDEIRRREAADRMNYEFANKDLAARAAVKTQAEKDREKQNLQAGESQLVADIETGKYPDASHDQLATMYGIPVARVKVLAEPGRARYEQRALDNLNIDAATMRAKTDPKKLNLAAIEGLKVKLPASLRTQVYFNPKTFLFERNNAPFNIAQPVPEVANVDELAKNWAATAPITQGDSLFNPNYTPPAMDAGVYNFSPTGGAAPMTATGTAPVGMPTPGPSLPPPSIPVAPVVPPAAQQGSWSPPVSAKEAADEYARREFQRLALEKHDSTKGVKVVTSKAEYEKLEDGEPYIDGYGRPAVKSKLKKKSGTLRDKLGAAFMGDTPANYSSKSTYPTNTDTPLDLNWFRKVRDEAAGAFMGN